MNNHHFEGYSFIEIRERIKSAFLSSATKVHPYNWQGTEVKNKPEAATYELMNVTLTMSLLGFGQFANNIKGLATVVDSSWPWCEDHFQERVCGFPINPGKEWKNWPYAHTANNFLDNNGGFNHNYMERYWPKYAGNHLVPSYKSEDVIDAQADQRISDMGLPHMGIRNEYGDLNDLVIQLITDPFNRQSWFPVFHPEDIGTVMGGRKPCTLGYQFILRNNQLHVWYPLRSCDFIRHFNDDIYLTIRLLMWVLDQCKKRGDPKDWDNVTLGSFSMHCTSLHVFANDYIQMGGKP